MSDLPAKLKRKIFWRSLFLQAFWNYERMQGLGFAYAIVPALKKTHGEGDDQREAIKKHSAYFNTQPYMASFILGVVAKLEGAKDEARTAAIKTAMGSALAGIGDVLFWGTLRPFCALLALAAWLILAACGVRAQTAMVVALAIYLISFNLPALLVRWKGLSVGYVSGEKIVDEIKRYHWQERIRWLRQSGRFLAVAITVSALLLPSWGWDKAAVYAVIFGAALAVKTYRWSAAKSYALFAISGSVLSFIIR